MLTVNEFTLHALRTSHIHVVTNVKRENSPAQWQRDAAEMARGRALSSPGYRKVETCRMNMGS